LGPRNRGQVAAQDLENRPDRLEGKDPVGNAARIPTRGSPHRGDGSLASHARAGISSISSRSRMGCRIRVGFEQPMAEEREEADVGPNTAVWVE
jgi:hypothetical protein